MGVDSFSTTHRKLSTGLRTIPTGATVSPNSTPSTTPSASTQTHSTSSSGSPRSLPCRGAGESNCISLYQTLSFDSWLLSSIGSPDNLSAVFVFFPLSHLNSIAKCFEGINKHLLYMHSLLVI